LALWQLLLRLRLLLLLLLLALLLALLLCIVGGSVARIDSVSTHLFEMFQTEALSVVLFTS
jgi:hypothetical protein